jgi:SNF2 family DNA or RNA helicase
VAYLAPRIHQLELKDALLSAKGNGVIGYHGMGLGKTYTTILAARVLITRFRPIYGDMVRVVVTCPKSAILTWKQELSKFAPDLIPYFIIVPYSQLKKFNMRIAKSNFHYVLLALDECHYIKNPQADRTIDFAIMLQHMAPTFHGKILPLTGTPIPNDGAEIYVNFWLVASPNIPAAIGKILDRGQFEKFRQMFTHESQATIKVKDFANPSGFSYRQVTSYKGVAEEEKFYQLIAPYVHYRRARDCVDMPEDLVIPVRLDIPDDDMLKGANMEMPDAYMSKLERIATAKTPYAVAWLEEFFKLDEQIVIFSLFTKGLRVLEQTFQGKIKLITGTESQTERAQTIIAFQQGKLKGIAMSYGAGAESLNLQNANNTLYLNFPWHDDKLAQAMARTSRSGQVRRTNHYFLFSGENDQACYERVLQKRSFNESLRERLRQGSGPKVIASTSHMELGL